MSFEKYFNENFIEKDGYAFTKTPSTTKEYRETLIDKDDLMELWNAAIESVDITGE